MSETMIDKLKISRSWAMHWTASGFVVRRQMAGDVEHVVVPAEAFDLMAAVVEAAIEHEKRCAPSESDIREWVASDHSPAARGALIFTVCDLRAHMEASDGKG